MAYKYTGDGILGISLNVNSPKPLDIRSVVNSTKDLYEILVVKKNKFGVENGYLRTVL